MRYLIAIAAVAALASPASAASYACENPGRTYNAVVMAGEVVINPDTTHTALQIIGRIDTDEIGALVLRTPDPTVTEILHTRPEPKMEVFSDGELVQVDPCIEL